jgi:hypothetical protein
MKNKNLLYRQRIELQHFQPTDIKKAAEFQRLFILN